MKAPDNLIKILTLPLTINGLEYIISNQTDYVETFDIMKATILDLVMFDSVKKEIGKLQIEVEQFKKELTILCN